MVQAQKRHQRSLRKSKRALSQTEQNQERLLAASFPACSACVLSGFAAAWMDYWRCHQTETHSSRHFLPVTMKIRHRWPQNAHKRTPIWTHCRASTVPSLLYFSCHHVSPRPDKETLEQIIFLVKEEFQSLVEQLLMWSTENTQIHRKHQRKLQQTPAASFSLKQASLFKIILPLDQLSSNRPSLAKEDTWVGLLYFLCASDAHIQMITYHENKLSETEHLVLSGLLGITILLIFETWGA